MCAFPDDPDLVRQIAECVYAPWRDALLVLLRRGVERGEVRSGAASDLVAELLPAVLVNRIVIQRERMHERGLSEILEHLLVPLIVVR